MRIVEWAPVSFNGSLPSFGAAFESHLAEIGNGAAYRSSASAWSLLYRVLERCGLPVGTVAFGEHGKPFFSDADVFFSLSHAGDLVAVSVSDAPTEKYRRGSRKNACVNAKNRRMTVILSGFGAERSASSSLRAKESTGIRTKSTPATGDTGFMKRCFGTGGVLIG